MARPTKQAAEARDKANHKAAILEQVEKAALGGAVNATRLLVAAVTPVDQPDGTTTYFIPKADQIKAAVYLLDQVYGSPGKREAPDDKKDQLFDLMQTLADYRKSPTPDEVDPDDDTTD